MHMHGCQRMHANTKLLALRCMPLLLHASIFTTGRTPDTSCHLFCYMMMARTRRDSCSPSVTITCVAVHLRGIPHAVHSTRHPLAVQTAAVGSQCWGAWWVLPVDTAGRCRSCRSVATHIYGVPAHNSPPFFLYSYVGALHAVGTICPACSQHHMPCMQLAPYAGLTSASVCARLLTSSVVAPRRAALLGRVQQPMSTGQQARQLVNGGDPMAGWQWQA